MKSFTPLLSPYVATLKVYIHTYTTMYIEQHFGSPHAHTHTRTHAHPYTHLHKFGFSRQYLPPEVLKIQENVNNGNDRKLPLNDHNNNNSNNNNNDNNNDGNNGTQSCSINSISICMTANATVIHVSSLRKEGRV